MNTANLQLEGLFLAIAAVNKLLVTKGLLSVDEVHTALRIAEETAIGDFRTEDLTPANRDAVAFPARLLQIANQDGRGQGIPPFSELAKAVGETKESYNDQR